MNKINVTIIDKVEFTEYQLKLINKFVDALERQDETAAAFALTFLKKENIRVEIPQIENKSTMETSTVQ